MKRIFNYMKKYKMLFIIPTISMFFLIGLDMINPYITGVIIDDVIVGGEFHRLTGLLILLILITLGRAVFGYIREYLFDYAGIQVGLDLRRDLFDHIQSLPFEYFDKTNTGEIMSRTTRDVDNVWEVVGFVAGFFLEQIFYVIAATTMMFFINWQLALVCTLVFPFLGYLALKMDRKMGTAYEEISDQDAKLNTKAQENIAGVRLVKSLNRENLEKKKFRKENKKLYQLNVKRNNILGNFHPKIEFLSYFATILVILVGGIFVINEQMTIGALVAFNGYVAMLVWPMRFLGWLTNSLSRCNASLKKIFTIMDEVPSIKNPENPVSPQKRHGSVAFRNVSFQYGKEKILNNIYLQIKPGSTVAIMGATGSGKTSLANLIPRYYDTSQGQILVDGVKVQDQDLQELRKSISVVMQDTFLFSDTLLENIKFGSQAATMEEVEQAMKDARVYDFIQEMPDGLETIIGERGVGLSGGQKQRISIARALLKKSPILIFDDATSALDMETEYQIQKALNKRANITKIIIAHRISAVKDADEIIILEDGNILEKGNHHQLLNQKGYYFNLYKNQLGDVTLLNKEVI